MKPNRTRIKALISTSHLLDKITLFIRAKPFHPFFPFLTLCCSNLHLQVGLLETLALAKGLVPIHPLNGFSNVACLDLDALGERSLDVGPRFVGGKFVLLRVFSFSYHIGSGLLWMDYLAGELADVLQVGLGDGAACEEYNQEIGSGGWVNLIQHVKMLDQIAHVGFDCGIGWRGHGNLDLQECVRQCNAGNGVGLVSSWLALHLSSKVARLDLDCFLRSIYGVGVASTL